VVRHDATFKIRLCSADRGIVVVQLDAEPARLIDRSVSDLDLVGLGEGTGDEEPCDPARSDTLDCSETAATKVPATGSPTAFQPRHSQASPGQGLGHSKGDSRYT
jgi:hypothetical protein